MPKPSSPSRRSPAHTASPETVDPGWLLKAGAIVVAFALLCVLCLFWTTFYFTQWQYVLSPSRNVTATPSSVGLAFTEVHFGVDATGQPQLDGWWIPSASPNSSTVIMLHMGDGTMADALPQSRLFHDVNLNVLLFDYRGFGRSGGTHPTQALMQADAESAVTYLRDMRHIELSHILVYGNGIGASIAVSLCANHNAISAVILESPLGDTEARVAQDTRTKLVPVHLLFHDQFPLAVPLRTLATPKLIITYSNTPSAAMDLSQTATPKMTVELPLSPSLTIEPSLRRFLDSYIPTAINPALQTSP